VVIQLAVGLNQGSPSKYKNGWQIRHASRSQRSSHCLIGSFNSKTSRVKDL
jgi:hypothetical protein